MEIASNYAVSGAPQSYQAATEEAKRDTRLREQILKPKQAERSAAQSKVADERGGTQSSAQTMAAQSQQAQSTQAAQILGQSAAGQTQQAAAASASGAVSSSSVLQSTQEKDERRAVKKDQDKPAQYQVSSKRNAAVAGRYNSIVPRQSAGQNLDIAV